MNILALLLLSIRPNDQESDGAVGGFSPLPPSLSICDNCDKTSLVKNANVVTVTNGRQNET